MISSKYKKMPKKSLDELIKDGSVVTGREVIRELKEKERRQKEFEESVDTELRNRRIKS